MNQTRFAPGRQRGLTLIELMVALTISLVLVLAAALLYLNTRSSQKATDERAQVYETGQAAIQLIGRELGKAGFYPAVAVESVTTEGADARSIRFNYPRAVNLALGGVLPVALARGVYGCDGQRVADTYAGCEDNEAGREDSDGLLVSYFTQDAFTLDVGDRADCSRTNVANAAVNATRIGTIAKQDGATTKTVSRNDSDASGLMPSQPLLVINRYFLKSIKYKTEGGAEVETSALACKGNGKGASVDLLVGVERLGFRYGVFSDESLVPTQFIAADEIEDLGSVSVGGGNYSGWQRVIAVRVCVLTRSFSGTALADAGASVTGCFGESYTAPSGVVVRKSEQVFSLKNMPGQLFGL
jgi:type IV pilus assembly protein PilW